MQRRINEFLAATPLLAAVAPGTAPVCTVPFAAWSARGTCFDFPLVRVMQHGPYQLADPHHPTPVQYIASSPCTAVDAAVVLKPPHPCQDSSCNCTSFENGQRAHAPAFIYAGSVCYALGDNNATPTITRSHAFPGVWTQASAPLSARIRLLNASNASAGVGIYFAGGASGSGCDERGVQFRMVCDANAPANACPAQVQPHTPERCDVTITWHTAAACYPVQVPAGDHCVAPPPPPPPPPPIDNRPHLVMVLADDMGWNDVGFHDSRIQTPTLDELARQGVRLVRHYVYRYCSPTRSSFLSGRLPYHDHQTNAGLFGGAFGTNVNMTLLPAKLQAAGYLTAMRGKWHCGFARPEYLPDARGFEDFAGYLCGGSDHFTEGSYCGVTDTWRSNDTYQGPDTRNGTGFNDFTMMADMVNIIRRHKADPRPLFLFASLTVVHAPIEAPPDLVARYAKSQPQWCKTKQTIGAMASIADNATAQIVGALKGEDMWQNTVLVYTSDNGGDSLMSSNFPLRGRKRSFFEGGIRTPTFVVSPLLPAGRAGGRVEDAFMHISDWYTTFLHLAKSDHPGDSGQGRFSVDGVDVWPYLVGSTTAAPAVAPPHANQTLVIGFNYSTMVWPVNGGYDKGTGALIEVDTGYKLIMGSQNLCQDCVSWDPQDYPCKTTPPGRDCTPHCLFNVLQDESERHDLSLNATGGKWLTP